MSAAVGYWGPIWPTANPDIFCDGPHGTVSGATIAFAEAGDRSEARYPTPLQWQECATLTPDQAAQQAAGVAQPGLLLYTNGEFEVAYVLAEPGGYYAVVSFDTGDVLETMDIGPEASGGDMIATFVSTATVTEILSFRSIPS